MVRILELLWRDLHEQKVNPFDELSNLLHVEALELLSIKLVDVEIVVRHPVDAELMADHCHNAPC